LQGQLIKVICNSRIFFGSLLLTVSVTVAVLEKSMAGAKMTNPSISAESGRRVELNCGEFVASIACGHSDKFSATDEMPLICNDNRLLITLQDGASTEVDWWTALHIENQIDIHRTPVGIACILVEGQQFLSIYISNALPSCGKCSTRTTVDKYGKFNEGADWRVLTDGKLISKHLWIETDQ
jgi:hypothetical protein